MSTPEPTDVKAVGPVGRILFQGLFDDAAVFPPGLAPLPQAVTDHVARQSRSYADLVGPLLLPASAIENLLKLEQTRPEAELKVALVARPGTGVAVVAAALARLKEHPAVTLSGVESGWSRDWYQTVSETALRSIEVPRGAELEDALSDIQEHANGNHRAKFRTGSTPEQPAPTSAEVATFIRACVDHSLSFKLTGGLHHAFSRFTSEGGHELGFLNVIAATRWALGHGAEVPEMEALLSERDPGPILDIITRMSEADASVLRGFFTSYGCCNVMDPIGDLAALGLIKETL